MLVSLADMKTFLGISDNTQDVFLTEQLNIVSETVESYCGRKFELANYAEHFHEEDFEVYQGGDPTDIYLTHYPIATLTSVARDTVLVDSSEYRMSKVRGFLRFDRGFFCGADKVIVTYSAGYATIPFPIQSSVKAIVQERYNKSTSGVALNFGNDVQRVSIPGTISIDFDYTLESNTRKTAFGTILGNHVNVLDYYRGEKRITGSFKVDYVV